MRTLFISHIFPQPPHSGNGQRVLHLLGALAEVSEVTFVHQVPAEGPAPNPDCLEHLVKRVYSFPRKSINLYKDFHLPRARRWVKHKLRYCHPVEPVLLQWEHSDEGQALVSHLCTERFDLIWAERLASMRLVPPGLAARVIVDLDDIEHRKLARHLRVRPMFRMLPLELLEYLRLRRLERSLWRLPFEFVVCSPTDSGIFRGNGRVHIVPNGVDLPTSPSIPEAPISVPVFLFVGHMGYQPNVDAVCFFRTRVLPLIWRSLPEARLLIVGREPDPLVRQLHDGSRVLVTGTVPSVEPYLRQATALVVPIRIGGGTRIKILEAMAHRLPVVTTTIGGEGLELEDDKHVLVADSPTAFARACLRLHSEPGLRDRLAEAGASLVSGTYRWPIIERLVKSIVQAAPQSPSRR